MKQNSINTPLWRELNEARTQGEWRVFETEGLFPSIIMHGTEQQFVESYGRNGFCMNVGGQDSKINANAAYTALAVNNLARLAEALEAAKNWIDAQITTSNDITDYDREVYQKCEQALAAIS